MKTAEQIIEIIKAELAEACEMHDEVKGKDTQQALYYLLKASTLTHLLDEIEEQ